MKIFLDTADIDAVAEAAKTGLIAGVTTNPSQVMKSGKRLPEVIKRICAIVSGPVSAQAMAESAEALVEEAMRIQCLAPNVYVKMPMTLEGLRAVRILELERNVRTNVTMIFSPIQAFLAMEAGATLVSIVLSRLDAIAVDSAGLVTDSVNIKRNFGYKSEILAASLKTQNHVLTCLRAGVDIITLPPSLFFQMYEHSLTDSGLAQFKNDWDKLPK